MNPLVEAYWNDMALRIERRMQILIGRVEIQERVRAHFKEMLPGAVEAAITEAVQRSKE